MSVRLRYRERTGEFADTMMDQASAALMVAGMPVREFRWYKGRRHYSGWYWSSTMGGSPHASRSAPALSFSITAALVAPRPPKPRDASSTLSSTPWAA
jgi:hypothetical protein